MKFFKSIFVLSIAIALTSCSSVSKIPVPQPLNNTVTLSAKKAPLTEDQKKNWAHADLVTDTIPGMSLDKAYKFLEGKKSTTVIVGVVDSGADIEHEDLQGNVWTNPKEIAGNGIDDDKNGFIDDIHGWNFLGKTLHENIELTRLLKKLKPRFDGKAEADIAEAHKKDFAQYQEMNKVFEAKQKGLTPQKKYIDMMVDGYNSLKKALNKEDLNQADLEAFKTEDADLISVKNLIINNVFKRGADIKGLIGYKDYLDGQLNYYYNLDFNGRKQGDNYEINIPKIYGDAHVIGDKSIEQHSTHVSGIIAAVRNNGKGMNGVATNVKIMAVRTVPEGDEYDKDVANGIRYAVDNGAKVINMSFGKGYSPQSQWVYDAIKYAASKDVLLVHAAGNDAADNDKVGNFPNDAPDWKTEISDNLITIGAMSSNYDEKLPASFSNYGKLNVDIFAPGVKIYSTIPNNKYEYFNGTSMASPEVAGIAAIIRSYYPKLSASQVKHILMNSGLKIEKDVLLPGGKGAKVPFADLSVTGRIVNAYNAVRMADQMVNGK
ncbi:MAG: S8 family serine peptidase [Flavobacteriales bacterium]|jgi:cell wall-associated protease|nr:S8 family serine peptidase [Flavobacteriales bacterium]